MTGGFGTIECEVVIESSFHTRTFAKTANRLIGYVTGANIPRCARGGATIARETLPWHVTYREFSGTLPNITEIGRNLINATIIAREPTFGQTCTIRSTPANPATIRTIIEMGRIIREIIGGTIICRGAIEVNVTFSESTSSANNGAGVSVSVTLI